MNRTLFLLCIGALLASTGSMGCNVLEDTSSNASALRRTVTAQPLFATSTENRIVDPEFTDVAKGQDARWSFFAEAEGGSPAAPQARRGPSPRGVTTSFELGSGSVLLEFIGGTGPFHASVWVADASGASEPTLQVGVMQFDPQGAFHPLEAREHVVIGGRTFVAFRAEIAEDLPAGGFLLVTALAGAVVVAPEILAGASERQAGARAPASRRRPLDAAQSELARKVAAAAAARRRKGAPLGTE